MKDVLCKGRGLKVRAAGVRLGQRSDTKVGFRMSSLSPCSCIAFIIALFPRAANSLDKVEAKEVCRLTASSVT